MPLLPDISVSSIPGFTPEEQLASIVRQINEWGRLLSNESPNTLTVVAQDTVTFPETTISSGGSDVQTTKTIPHHLGYVPIFLSYYNLPVGASVSVSTGGFPDTTVNAYVPITDAVAFTTPIGTDEFGNIGGIINIRASVDDTNLYIYVGESNPSSSATGTFPEFNVRYYILQQEAKGQPLPQA